MTLGEQRRKALATAASQRQSGQRFEQAFHNRRRKSVEPIRPIEWQRRDAIRNLFDKLLFHLNVRASSATAPHLPDAGRQRQRRSGQTRDLPASDAILLHVMWPSTPAGRQHLALTVPHILHRCMGLSLISVSVPSRPAPVPAREFARLRLANCSEAPAPYRW